MTHPARAAQGFTASYTVLPPGQLNKNWETTTVYAAGRLAAVRQSGRRPHMSEFPLVGEYAWELDSD